MAHSVRCTLATWIYRVGIPAGPDAGHRVCAVFQTPNGVCNVALYIGTLYVI